MSEPVRDSKRKKLLIEPRFQLSFISYTCVIGALLSGILFGANRYFFWKLEQRGLSLGLPPEHVFFKFLREQSSQMDLIYAVTALVTFLILVVFGLYFSNKVAGPIYNVRKNLMDRLAGLPERRIKFRKHDYFHELAESLNQYFEKAKKGD